MRHHTTTVLLICTLLVDRTLAEGKFEQQYLGDAMPQHSDMQFSELRVSGGGKTSLTEGKLRVEVLPGASHFYNLSTDDSSIYNGSSEEGSTLDFAVTTECADLDQVVFSIRAGTGSGSWQLLFFPQKIQIGSRIIEHSTTEPDVYRMTWQNDKLTIYSGRAGELARDITAEERYQENRISFGTRRMIAVNTPLAWELDLIRWTNKEAIFAPPSSE